VLIQNTNLLERIQKIHKIKLKKNRQAKGKALPHTKLTEEQVREIRKRYATGMYTYESLAKEYNFKSVNSFGMVITGKRWSWVDAK